MFSIISCIGNEHDLRLVAVAALICVLSAVAAFSFDRRRETAPVQRRVGWAALTGMVAGSGVWAVHFIATLAFMPDLPIKFDIGGTALSLVVSIATLSAGFSLSTFRRTGLNAVLGGVVVGLGVTAMHFTGISATVTAMQIAWDPSYVVASIVIGIILGGASLWTARRASGRYQLVLPPLLLVLTIIGMHFTAMTAMSPLPDLTVQEPGLVDRGGLAIPIALIAGLILLASLGANWLQLQERKTFVRNLQSAFHRLPAALLQVDAQGRLVLWNQAYVDLMSAFGVEPKPGMRRMDLIDAADARGAFNELGGAAAYLAGQREGQVLDWPLSDGRWLQVETCSLSHGDTLTVVTDVTGLRSANVMMMEARDRAEAASRSKSDFLSNMSHEIRTPLNGVLGMVQVMEANSLSAAQRERLRTIKQSGVALMALLNDVLDLSKIEAGKLELTSTEFEIGCVAKTACAALEGVAAGKDVRLLCVVETEVEGTWRGDALRIRQILTNLISNAVKFTDEGEVRLVVASAPGGVAFEVQDTGVGIAQDQIDRLFERFMQEDATTTRRFGGTGLGLTICRELAELMGGRIEATSVKGHGSCFRLVLPLERLECSAAAWEISAASPQQAEHPIRVLAAEDNSTNQLVLRALLEPLGVELTMTSDGREAVEAFRAAIFDVVLMDVQMPEMNGVDACRAIRALETELRRPRTPIVAVTANVMQHQIDEYITAGMDVALAKPIEIEKLYAVLDRALNSQQRSRAAA